MNKLTLETFLAAGPDLEANQYRILSGLKAFYDDFSHNRLYPPLADLIELASTIELLLKERANIDQKLSQQIKGIDLQHRRLVYGPLKAPSTDIERVAELAAWALPHVKKTIEEGLKIYDFVDENLAIEEVGILPVYREEGYYFVPENKSNLLHLIRYQVSLFTSGSERFWGLKTRILKSVDQEVITSSSESLKLKLIEDNRELPNPATYLCETDLDFPFAETIFPVAKRKLMARLVS